MLQLMVRRVFLRMLRRISKDHRKNKQPSCEGQEIADHFLSILIGSSSRAARSDAKVRQLLGRRSRAEVDQHVGGTVVLYRHLEAWPTPTLPLARACEDLPVNRSVFEGGRSRPRLSPTLLRHLRFAAASTRHMGACFRFHEFFVRKRRQITVPCRRPRPGVSSCGSVWLLRCRWQRRPAPSPQYGASPPRADG